MSKNVDELFNLETNKSASFLLNPFEVLEPVKVDNILVDLSTDNESTVKNKSDSLQMGSFIDTIRKTEYDLVDLYQNMYVTPNHVKKSNTGDNKGNMIDFADFFDKLELSYDKSKANHTDSSSDFELSKTSEHRTNFDWKMKERLKNNCSPTFLSNASIHNVHSFTLNNNINGGKSDHEHKYESKIFNDKLSAVEKKFKKEMPVNVEKNHIQNVLRIDTHKFINDLKNNVKQEKRKQVIDMINDIQLNGNFKNGQLLHTVKKDEKLYAKQRSLTDQTKNLTEGADIYEKSIVLPQIMQRLAERKKILEEQKKFKKRLVLDNGIDQKHRDSVIDNRFEPVILMEDCNAERLKNLGARLLFQDFVKNGRTE